MRKKKILIMTDSARVYTGFANIGRHVAGYLHDTGRWDVHYLGWFDEGSNEAIAQTPYPLYHTIKDDKGRRLPQDSYGFLSFPKIVEHVKPDIVLSIGDRWMVCHHTWIHPDKETRPYHSATYVPIDHDPVVRMTRHMMGPQGSFDLDWAADFKRFDSVVGYCKYGMDEINTLCGEEVCTKFIYHGVDRDIWKPLPQEERMRLRKEIFGMDSNDFLIISVGRNQPRKLYPVMAEALRIFMEQYEKGRPVYHYYHCPLQDPVGWNLQEILHVAGVSHRLLKEPHHVGRRVILNDQLGVGVGPTDEELNQLVNCADLFLMAHSGEGWGLPILEAMAAGVPTVSTGYSAPTDWAKDATHFIPAAQIYPEPQTGFRRAWVLPQDIADSINAVYSNKDYRKELKKKGLEVAEECDWDQRVLPEWEEYLDSLPLRKREKEIIYLRDADKLEAVDEGVERREMPLISVIIPTHVGGPMLKQCVGSLMAAGYPKLDVIVVDNGAWDPQTKPVIRELRDRGIRILDWNKKYIPSRVLNMAAREARGDFILFLDNDTAMQPGAIHAMVNCFNERGCGISSVKLVHPEGQQFSTGMDYDYRLGFIPSRTGEGVVRKAAVAGSCMMVPSALFRQLGGFDEGFRLFWQDADLCIRALAAGYHTLVNLSASCMHVGGVSRRYVSRSTNLADTAYLRRKHWPEYMPSKGNNEKEDVVIIKLLTMGDAILITPMLPEIRKRHPNARVTLYTLQEYSDIFTHNPYIDVLKTVGPLNRDEFGPSWSLFAYDAIIENILSTTKWDHVYACNQLDYWMEYRRAGTTMAQTYQDMFSLEVKDQRYQLYSTGEDRAAVRKLIEEYPGDGPVVVMHTTAGWPLKEWTKEGWKELAKKLYEEYQARIFVVGGPNEVLDSTYVRNIGGRLSLTQLACLIAEATLFIGGDSGPLHLAKAAPWIRTVEDLIYYRHGRDVAILALFACTNPMVVGFDEVPNYITIQSHYAGVVNCGFPTCPMEKIAKDNDKEFIHCSKRIDIEHVWKAARKLLNRGEYSVREHWKGAEPCSISFTEWEWVVRRLAGQDPPDMCPYGKDLVPEEAWK